MPIHPFLILFAAAGFALLRKRCEKQNALFLIGAAFFLLGNGVMTLYADQVRIAVRDALQWVGLWG